MRIARKKQYMGRILEVIEDVGVVEKRNDYRNYGDCLYVDGIVFEVKDRMDEIFNIILKEGYADLREYENFELGI